MTVLRSGKQNLDVTPMDSQSPSTSLRQPTPKVSSSDTRGTTARFRLPAEGFAFASMFERTPDARIECEAMVANPADHALVVIRTEENNDVDATAIRADSGVTAVDCFSERSDGIACRVTWGERPHSLIQQLTAADISLLSMRGYGGIWEFRVLSPHREGIGQAQEIMDMLECGADCESVMPFDGNEGSLQSRLTDRQRTALLTAFERGYYDIPRSVTTQDIANELEISHQALSERFRRAHKELVAADLPTE